MCNDDNRTIEKILIVAERHFAIQGFFISSIRKITKEAGVNIAAINYHFGSKKELFLAVLNRRIVPFVTEFLTTFNDLEKTRNIQAEDLVKVYVKVILNLIENDKDGSFLVSKLITRLLQEEYKIFRNDLSKNYDNIVLKLKSISKKTFPYLNEESLNWRIHIAFTTLFNVFAGNFVLSALMPSMSLHKVNTGKMVEYVIPFVVSGLIGLKFK